MDNSSGVNSDFLTFQWACTVCHKSIDAETNVYNQLNSYQVVNGFGFSWPLFFFVYQSMLIFFIYYWVRHNFLHDASHYWT